MHYRRLGRSGLKVSEISLGAWVTFGFAPHNLLHTSPSLPRGHDAIKKQRKQQENDTSNNCYAECAHDVAERQSSGTDTGD